MNVLEQIAEQCGVNYVDLANEIGEIATEAAERVRAREIGEEMQELQTENNASSDN